MTNNILIDATSGLMQAATLYAGPIYLASIVM